MTGVKGCDLAKFDGELTAAGEASLDMVELLSLLAASPMDHRDRSDAIACYLSASEGWRAAKGMLKGNFAALATATRLTNGKDK